MDANLFSSAKWNYSTDYDLIIEIRKSQEIMFPGFYFYSKVVITLLSSTNYFLQYKGTNLAP